MKLVPLPGRVLVLDLGLRGFRSARDAARGMLAPDGERARSGRNAVTAFAVRLASAALLYFSQILIARWTGSHEYGIYVYAWTLVLLLSAFAHGGLNTTLMRMIPELREKGEDALSRGLIAGGRVFTLVSSSVIALVAIVIVLGAGDRISSHYATPLILAFLCIPAYALTDLHDGLGRANGWMAEGLAPPYLLRPFLLLVGVMAALSLGAGADATTVAGVAVLATIATMALQFVLLERRLADTLAKGPRRYAFGQWFRISIPLVIIGISDMLLHHTDIIVISIFLTASDAGIYFAAAKTMSLMLYVHFAVGSAVAYRFSALNAAGDRVALAATVGDAVRWTFWPSLAAGVLILFLGKPLLWLFGPQFADGYPVMMVLVIGFVLRGAFGPIEFVLNMLGEQRRCAIVLVIAAIVNVALNLLLVPAYGTLGAAIATAGSMTGAAIANYLIAIRYLGLDSAIWARSGRTDARLPSVSQ